MNDEPIKSRLLKGATLLGEIWRSGVRCADGWRVMAEDGGALAPDGFCRCPEKSRFCKARGLWIEIAVADGRDVEPGEFGLALMMTASEWDASGLTLYLKDFAKIKDFAVGPKGQISMEELGKVAQVPDSLPSVLALMRRFPGSKAVEIEQASARPESEFAEEGEGAKNG